MVAAFISK